MTNRKYSLKKLESNLYVPYLLKTVDFQVTPLEPFTKEKELEAEVSSFTEQYDIVTIPTEIVSNLEKLLDNFSLCSQKSYFLTLIGATQNAYRLFYEHDKGVLNNYETDYETEKEDLEKLLVEIEKYWFDKNSLNPYSISFKYHKNKPSVALNNFFIKKDIYLSISKGLGIDKENFKSRKIELLKDCNSFKYSKGDELIKFTISNMLCGLLSHHVSNKSDVIRFIICFLHLCQIKSNNNDNSKIIELSSSDFDLVEIDDIKNMNNYLKRKKSFYL